jgi:hypothetical protein
MYAVVIFNPHGDRHYFVNEGTEGRARGAICKATGADGTWVKVYKMPEEFASAMEISPGQIMPWTPGKPDFEFGNVQVFQR